MKKAAMVKYRVSKGYNKQESEEMLENLIEMLSEKALPNALYYEKFITAGGYAKMIIELEEAGK